MSAGTHGGRATPRSKPRRRMSASMRKLSSAKNSPAERSVKTPTRTSLERRTPTSRKPLSRSDNPHNPIWRRISATALILLGRRSEMSQRTANLSPIPRCGGRKIKRPQPRGQGPVREGWCSPDLERSLHGLAGDDRPQVLPWPAGAVDIDQSQPPEAGGGVQDLGDDVRLRARLGAHCVE